MAIGYKTVAIRDHKNLLNETEKDTVVTLSEGLIISDMQLLVPARAKTETRLIVIPGTDPQKVRFKFELKTPLPSIDCKNCID